MAQNALTEFFATLPNNLGGGAATIAEEETTKPTQSEPPTALPIPEPATAKSAPIAPLQASPTITALSMLAHGNPPPPIPTEGQTQIGPDSTSRTPLRLSITSNSEGKYDENSEVSDIAEDEATALYRALLEEDKPEDDDGYRSEDDANTTGTATPEAEDPYDIPGPEHATVVTTPTGPTNMDISPSQKRNIHYPAFLFSFFALLQVYTLVASSQECTWTKGGIMLTRLTIYLVFPTWY